MKLLKACKNNIQKILFNVSGGNERTIRTYRNISGSFIIKGSSVLISFILVPLTIDLIDPVRYGIWITLSSIINWFGFFDIGLGHGLRNKFAEAIAQKRHNLARSYVSTTYLILTIIITSVLIIFSLINPFIRWDKVLNVEFKMNNELFILAQIVFTFFCFRFVLKLITTLLSADQRSAQAEIFELLIKILTLISIFFLTHYSLGSLLSLGFVISGIPVFVLTISSIWFYNRRYKPYCPSIKYVKIKYSTNLMNLGVKFFVIQIAALLLYQTNNIIIAQLFGPALVTPYNIAFKYFSIITLGFSIIVVPYWSAYTEAFVLKDYSWISKNIKKLINIWKIFFVLGIVMLLISSIVYKIWIGNKVIIPFTMSLVVFLYSILNAWSSIFSTFLNGIGKIKAQLFIGIIGAFINVPLAVFLGKTFGILGVLSSNVLIGIAVFFIYPYQYKNLITNRAIGIWNK